jgi:hypothetical protein
MENSEEIKRALMWYEALRAENAELRDKIEIDAAIIEGLHRLAEIYTPQIWVPVSERLPEPGHNVLIFWRNELGGGSRISMGYHAPALTLEANDEWDDECCDIVDGGAYYQKPGWYENPWEVERCASLPGVIAWQPLPAPPQEPNHD